MVLKLSQDPSCGFYDLVMFLGLVTLHCPGLGRLTEESTKLDTLGCKSELA
jgi:hypothetical protein